MTLCLVTLIIYMNVIDCHGFGKALKPLSSDFTMFSLMRLGKVIHESEQCEFAGVREKKCFTYSLGLGLVGIGGPSLAGDGDVGGVVSPVGGAASFTFIGDRGLSLVNLVGAWLLGRVPLGWCSVPVAT